MFCKNKQLKTLFLTDKIHNSHSQTVSHSQVYTEVLLTNNSFKLSFILRISPMMRPQAVNSGVLPLSLPVVQEKEKRSQKLLYCCLNFFWFSTSRDHYLRTSLASTFRHSNFDQFTIQTKGKKRCCDHILLLSVTVSSLSLWTSHSLIGGETENQEETHRK